MPVDLSYTDFCPVTDLDNLNATLDKYGVAVIKDVFTESECDAFTRPIFEYLASELNVREPDDYKRLRPYSGGTLHLYGISLLKPVLDVKTDKRVVEPFMRIWNCKDESELCTTFDKFFILPPQEEVKNSTPQFYDENDLSIWFHVDHATDEFRKVCIQSAVNLFPIEHGDGCLATLTYSHKYFKEYVETFKADSKGNRYHQIGFPEYEWFLKKGCVFNTITAPKGSMVFWDTRLVHMGMLPRRGRDNPKNWRVVHYVCYTPAKWQSKKDKELKIKAYLENRVSIHWPFNVVLNPNPRPVDDKKVNKLEDLTDRHRKLLGMDIEY